MSNEFKEELNKMETGSVALVFSDPSSDLTVEVTISLIYLIFSYPYGPDHYPPAQHLYCPIMFKVVGWKGKTSIRAYVPRNDRLHYMRCDYWGNFESTSIYPAKCKVDRS